ncbi:unnamed protein product [Caenorhabditis angaria]|uniref:C-type lectin domain-containing protein n=1 Tax=Caenorhabditis angaria TaxID=860376 RepID=A0A9P1IBP1_9PELO|nr:unnamed protein product [Caenorhabditis angaria]
MVRFIIIIAAILVFPVDLCFPTRSTQIILPQLEISDELEPRNQIELEQENQMVSTDSKSTSITPKYPPPYYASTVTTEIPITQCDDGWSYYERATTGWCMKVVAQQNINKAQAEKVCSDLGAVISSIDDSAMNDRLLNLKSIAGATNTWLGADMKSECICGEKLCVLTEDCGPNGYYWTDGYTTSNDYISNNLVMFTLLTNDNNVEVEKYVSSDGLIMDSIPKMILKVLMALLCLQFEPVGLCNVRPEIRCEDGWTYYKRNTTGWCMKVLVGSVNLARAKVVCSGVGAVMSSIDDVEMYNSAANLLASTSSRFSWLGAELKSECNCGANSCPVTDNCGRNGYYWTDGYTTSNDFILTHLSVVQELINGQEHYTKAEGVVLSRTGIQVGSALYNAGSVLCGKQSNN